MNDGVCMFLIFFLIQIFSIQFIFFRPIHVQKIVNFLRFNSKRFACWINDFDNVKNNDGYL